MPLIAGAAQIEITPENSQVLCGYPHVERRSTGVHDPLLSSALYLSDSATELMCIGNDIVFVPKGSAQRIREQIKKATGIPLAHIMVTATHTHSGPVVGRNLANSSDPAMPDADPDYLQFMETRIVEAAVKAYELKQPARMGLSVADATGVGTNRRDPAGPLDLGVPVLLVQSADGSHNIAAMLICCMHPTVLHEDSTLISGDFPGMARFYLQENVLGKECVVVHHTGPCGNQSPRYVTRANTFEEAVRLGEILGRAVGKVVSEIEFTAQVILGAAQQDVQLPPKSFPTPEEAEILYKAAEKKLAYLRDSKAPAAAIRTAEVDWFGAEKTVMLARTQIDGRLAKAVRSVMPAEIQIFSIGGWRFVAWPGEIFVEYGLAVKKKRADTYVISLANGTLQGYISTSEMTAAGGYEAANGLFSPESGEILVEKSAEMLDEARSWG